jgi:hypothetical protein
VEYDHHVLAWPLEMEKSWVDEQQDVLRHLLLNVVPLEQRSLWRRKLSREGCLRD